MSGHTPWSEIKRGSVSGPSTFADRMMDAVLEPLRYLLAERRLTSDFWTCSCNYMNSGLCCTHCGEPRLEPHIARTLQAIAGRRVARRDQRAVLERQLASVARMNEAVMSGDQSAFYREQNLQVTLRGAYDVRGTTPDQA